MLMIALERPTKYQFRVVSLRGLIERLFSHEKLRNLYVTVFLQLLGICEYFLHCWLVRPLLFTHPISTLGGILMNTIEFEKTKLAKIFIECSHSIGVYPGRCRKQTERQCGGTYQCLKTGRNYLVMRWQKVGKPVRRSRRDLSKLTLSHPIH